MPFQSKEQFFYLLYNEPDVFMDWVEDYGVPKEFKVGSTEHWLRKIKQMEPKRKRKFAEEFSAYNPPQAAVNNAEYYGNCINMAYGYFEDANEMQQIVNEIEDGGNSIEISKKEFMKYCKKTIPKKVLIGDWGYMHNPVENLYWAIDNDGDIHHFWMGAESFEAYNPPQVAVNNAKRGLRLREKWNRGGMSPAEARKAGIDSGVTRAKKISSGSVSKHDVRRMSAFNRHRKNYAPSKKKPDGGPTAGTIAWLLWGGTSGVDWAKKKSAAMNAEDGAIAFGAESDESKLRKYEKTYGKTGAKVRLKLLKSIKGKNIYGTKAGQWSARKSQHLADEYEKAMTKKGAKPYKSSKRTKAQKSLKKWGDQKWKTKSGKKSSVTGERYLPSKAIDALTEKEYAKTTAAKRKAKKAGKQFSRQPPAIAKKVAAYRAEYKVGTQGPCWDGYKYVGPKPYSSGSCVKKAENIDIQGNSPKAKVDTLRGGVEAFTYDLTQLKEGDLMRDFLKGVINAFQTSIKGVNVAGMDKTLEEIAVKFLPNAEMRAELMAQEGYSENEHYHMGEVWGYDEVINFLSLYQVDFQRQFASEIEDKLQEDTELTKKEIKTIMWYPLVIGFIGGTLATVVGNVLSALYLKRKHGLWSSQE